MARRLDGEADVVLKVSDSEWEFRYEEWLCEQGLQREVGSPAILGTFPLMRRPWTVCVMEALGPNLCTTWDTYRGQETKLRLAAKPMMQGLLVAHAAEIVHTDLKPLNICEPLEGHGPGWRLIDWGCAKNMEDKHREGKKGSGRKGAPTYQSPEMLSDQGWDAPTDIWSFAVTLAELYLGTVWDKARPTLFLWPDSDSHVPDVLCQIEDLFGRLPRRMRKNMAEKDRYGKHKGWFYARLPPLLNDVLVHMFLYDPDKRATAEQALRHAWFAVDDLTTPSLEAWLGQTFDAYEQSWKLEAVERTSINAIIQVLAARGDVAQATKWLDRAVAGELDVDMYTFNAVVENCLKVKSSPWPEAAEKWMLKMIEKGHKPREGSIYEVVTERAKADVDAAERLVEQLRNLDAKVSTRVFTPLAAAHGKAGDFERAERVLEWLQDAGLNPDARFFSALMQAFANAPRPPPDLADRAEFLARFVILLEPKRGQPPLAVDGPAKAAAERAMGGERWKALREEPQVASRLNQSSAGRGGNSSWNRR